MVLAYGFWNAFGKFLPLLVLTLCENKDKFDYETPILTQWGFLGIMLPIFLWLPETPGLPLSDVQCCGNTSDPSRLSLLRYP